MDWKNCRITFKRITIVITVLLPYLEKERASYYFFVHSSISIFSLLRLLLSCNDNISQCKLSLFFNIILFYINRDIFTTIF